MPEFVNLPNRLLEECPPDATVKRFLDMGYAEIAEYMKDPLERMRYSFLDCDRFWQEKCAYNLGPVRTFDFDTFQEVWILWMVMKPIQLYNVCYEDDLDMSEWYWEQRVRWDIIRGSEKMEQVISRIKEHTTYFDIWHQRGAITLSYKRTSPYSKIGDIIHRRISEYLSDYLTVPDSYTIVVDDGKTCQVRIYGLPIVLNKCVTEAMETIYAED